MGITQTPAVLSLDLVSKTYTGAQKPALNKVSFSVKQGEFFSILGPSGSGKTTILRTVAGFERPDHGNIVMDGKAVNNVPPFKRDVRTVFQSYALFPHLTVRENVEYPLSMQGEWGPDRRRKASDMLALVEMADFGDRLPHQLSGGQRQRVALARSLVSRPKLLLLDEPLAALDLRLRQQMQHTLVALQKELGIAFMYVTHDQGEALSMSDRVVVVKDGEVAQLATPREIYFSPQNEFVSRFVGRSNLLPVEFEDGAEGCTGSIMGRRIEGLTSSKAGTARMAIRYEAIQISELTASNSAAGAMRGVVEDVLFLGTNCEVNVRCGDLHLIGSVPTARETTFAVGQPVSLDFDLTNSQVFHD
ncbi:MULTISPECIES: ABC transporter ATP-binding protein [Agrobacterium]|uniref:ABC transporter ATP-binding protein n=1 Tax=Agrobacterium arsenijevicii TaxID=1585697 RepID=A0ABR5D1H9_9HYPH|nr:ABC transporter ATP-binding protein [Agrobacterium fabrum]KJF70905.1 ABC transporter ATP-binding protein [Agrobacterium arsenijevicii]CUX58824.1 putative spermidine/putrescine transporter subunit; ATP-binding component of ABC superfamily tranporter [Agrobacterium fabrum str. J-07]